MGKAPPKSSKNSSPEDIETKKALSSAVATWNGRSTEWLSLLRHIAHAPDAPSQRWQELRTAASACANRHQPRQKSMLQLPEFDPHVLRQPVQHRLGRI